jgi:hypothetical protein
MLDSQSVISAPAVPLSSSGLVEAAYFPDFGSRISRAFQRFGGKPLSFLSLSLLALSFPTLAFFWAGVGLSFGGARSLLAGAQTATVFASLITVTGIVMFLAVQAAIGAAAAFKVTFLRALGVGLSRSGWYLMSSAASLFALVIPSMLVLPNLVFTPRLLLVLPVVLAEKRHSWQAMARSRDLVTGHTLRLAIELFTLNLLTAAVVAGGAALAPTMTGILRQTLQGPLAPLLPFASYAVAVVIWTVCQVFFMPLNLIYLQVFYEDCVKEKGWDWEAKTWRIRGYQLLALLGVAVVIGVPSFGGWKLLQEASRSQVHVPSAPPTIEFGNTASGPSAAEQPAVTTKPMADSPAARDLERYERLSLLKIALASFQSDHYAFPAALEELMPKYMTKAALDPQTNAPFQYRISVGGGEFAVSFTLEEGVFALSKGTHTMSSRGFDLPVDLTGAAQPVTTPSATAPTPLPDVSGQMPQESDVFAPADVFDSTPTPIEEATASQPADEEVATAPVPAMPTDTDGDLLSDAFEKRLGTDYSKPDTDGDTLSDAEEVLVYGTDPLLADTDGDGFSDAKEVSGGFNPRGAGKLSSEAKAASTAALAKLKRAASVGLIIDSEKF